MSPKSLEMACIPRDERSALKFLKAVLSYKRLLSSFARGIQEDEM